MNQISATLRDHASDKYGERPLLAWIDKRSLIIDPRYQRSIDTRKSQQIIRQIRDGFSWKKCGPLQVTGNGDGTYCVVDGQHRLAAIMELEDIRDVPCWDMGEMTLQEQAMTFVEINTARVAVTPIAVHFARAKAGDPVAREMERVAAAAGCRFKNSGFGLEKQKPGEMTCLSTVRKSISKHGPDLTIRALKACRTSWDDAGGISSVMLQASIDLLVGGMSDADLLARLKYRRPDQVMAVAYQRRAARPEMALLVHAIAVISEGRGRVHR